MALADPHAVVESLRDTCRRVLAASEQQERLIEALLTLARSQRGLESREPVDLREVTAEVRARGAAGRACVETELGRGVHDRRSGDGRAARRQPDRERGPLQRAGRLGDGVDGPADGDCRPSRSRTPDRWSGGAEVDELVKPFYRAGGNGNSASANGNGHGLGLGLSIVHAIAEAHGATLSTEPRPDGGLRVTVAFPAARAASGD